MLKDFPIVEAEVNVVKVAREGVSAGSGASSSSVAQRVVALEVAMQREVATIQGNVQELKSGIESVPLMISSALSTAAATFTGVKCHCEHVDQLDARLALVEASNAAAAGRSGEKTDAWQHGSDPWRPSSLAATFAPMMSPPGMPRRRRWSRRGRRGCPILEACPEGQRAHAGHGAR